MGTVLSGSVSNSPMSMYKKKAIKRKLNTRANKRTLRISVVSEGVMRVRLGLR
jgi:hypothetical protein